jgi:branched-chain amino acid transport system substrate-binding protein
LRIRKYSTSRRTIWSNSVRGARLATDERVMSRRQALRWAGLGIGGLSLSSLLGGCAGGASAVPSTGSVARTGVTSGGAVRIAFISPRSGAEAELGAADSYVVGLVEKALGSGLPSGGKVYPVEISAHDGATQDPASLLTAPGVDLFLVTGSPAVVNAVADTAEMAGIPCISTGIPWEAWVAGRNAKPDSPAPFKSTFHFGYGTAQLTSAVTTLWPQVATNRHVGVLWPDDPVGKQLRAVLAPALTKAGYTVTDPGPPGDATTGWAPQIAKLKTAGCQILDAYPGPAGFVPVCREMTAQRFAPRIAQFGEAAMLPSQIEAAGAAALRMSSACWWHPTWPYSSPLTGLAASDLAAGYEAATGHQWIQQLGSTMALFEVAAAAIIASADPKAPQAMTGAMRNLSVDTMAGHLAWGSGPNQNVVVTPIAGGQWLKRDSEHLDFAICENSCDPNIPVAAQLEEYR